MRKIRKITAVIMSAIMCAGVLTGISITKPQNVKAVNPIVQDVYTADPAPMVCSDGRLYVYTSHDEDVLVDKGGHSFTMNDWKCYSTTDMVNWTDHGTVLSYHEFEWADPDSSWAGQVVERDGKFYYYVPINKGGTNSIAVAVSDSPTGPFEDPLGEPLLGPTYSYIDPTVYVDVDGQAYIYWGNPNLCCAKLNDDMISYDKTLNSDGFVNGIKVWKLAPGEFPELNKIDNSAGKIADGSYNLEVSDACKQAQAEFGIGTRVDNNKVRRPTLYEEGPWFYGRNGKYYMIYAANGIPERIDYSMSDSPLGPWEYKGMILDDKMDDNNGTGSFTNHPGVVDYKGHSYIFYHTGQLDDGGGFHRSVAIEEITYNEDGTINTVPMTKEGVESIDTFNPYNRVEAETFEHTNSLKATKNDKLGKYCVEKKPVADVATDICLTDIQNDDYICIRNVDFTQYGAVKFSATTKAEAGGTINVYLDNTDSDSIAEIQVKSGSDEWITTTVEVDKNTLKGVHDVFMVFNGDNESENLFDFDYWKFIQMELPATPTPVVTPAPVINTPAPSALISTAAPVKAPAKAKISSVKGAKAKMTVKVKKVSGAKGYMIAYSVNKSFKKSVKTKLTNKTSVTIKKLNRRKIYYVKAKAYKINANGEKVFGKYGPAVKVKVK